MTNITRILLVARPGRVRDGLRAVLRALPEIEKIEQAEDTFSALKITAQYSPLLVLLDSNLPDDPLQTLLKQIKKDWPQTRCIALVSNIKQQQLARLNGADEILLSGFSATSLLDAIQTFLPERQAANSEKA